jgi:uncharacterized protein (DUF1330 family)
MQITKEFLISEYKTKSVRQIATELGKSYTGVRYYFEKYEIPLREHSYAMRIAMKNPDVRRKISEGNRGKKLSEETKNKIGRAKFKGRLVRKDGYILIKLPKHPKSFGDGYVLEHRLVMEKFLGRYLKSTEIVHHIDGNRSNNHLSNLMLFPDKSAHFRHRHNEISLDFKSPWYKNCKRRRLEGAKICNSCPFKNLIIAAELKK